MSREAARLKGKLIGSNKRLRFREGEDEAASAPARRTSDDDDEDESRAGAIKKKQKLDLFNITHGKKKKKHHAKNDEVEQGKPLSVGQSSSQNPQNDVRKPDSLQDATQSPSKTQKSSKQESLAPKEDLSPLQYSALEEYSSALTKNEHPPKPGSSMAVVTSPNRLSESDRKTGPTSTLPNAIFPRTAELLKRPLLNLTGPPANSDDEESDVAEVGATQSPLTSPKKRRKRKKRKHHLMTESTCHSTTTAATVLQGVQT